MWFDPSEDSETPSLNATNYYTRFWLGDPSLSGGAVDLGSSMYVANRPLLSVGELGFLVRGTTVGMTADYPYFSSLRLFDTVRGPATRPRDRVFEHLPYIQTMWHVAR